MKTKRISKKQVIDLLRSSPLYFWQFITTGKIIIKKPIKKGKDYDRR